MVVEEPVDPSAHPHVETPDAKHADTDSADPRLDSSFVRTVPATRSKGGVDEHRENEIGEDGSDESERNENESDENESDDADEGEVHLVGVVHDHPASIHRVREVVRAVGPSVLALELPPVAVPLFERYAEDHRSPPPFGGEMSAAVQEADDARVVGVDAPDRQFLRLFAGRLLDERPPVGVTRRLLRGLLSVSRHAVVCRLAAVLAGRTGLRVEVEPRFEHAVTTADPPIAQAEDERRQIGRSRSLQRLATTPAVDIRDDIREESVAAHLDALRDEGDVVAVLGCDHIDGVAHLLDERAETD